MHAWSVALRLAHAGGLNEVFSFLVYKLGDPFLKTLKHTLLGKKQSQCRVPLPLSFDECILSCTQKNDKNTVLLFLSRLRTNLGFNKILNHQICIMIRALEWQVESQLRFFQLQLETIHPNRWICLVIRAKCELQHEL
jgi:hypothetical protein